MRFPSSSLRAVRRAISTSIAFMRSMALSPPAAWNAGAAYTGGAHASGSYANGADGGTVVSTSLGRA